MILNTIEMPCKWYTGVLYCLGNDDKKKSLYRFSTDPAIATTTTIVGPTTQCTSATTWHFFERAFSILGWLNPWMWELWIQRATTISLWKLLPNDSTLLSSLKKDAALTPYDWPQFNVIGLSHQLNWILESRILWRVNFIVPQHRHWLLHSFFMIKIFDL